MPRYFFDHHDGAILVDAVGVVLADSEAAIREAITALPQIDSESSPSMQDRQNLSIVVREEDGRPHLHGDAVDFLTRKRLR